MTKEKLLKMCNSKANSVLLTFEISCRNAEAFPSEQTAPCCLWLDVLVMLFQVTRNIHWFTQVAGDALL